MTSVTIPTSVTSIGSFAFESCSGLTSVIIPNSVTSINEQTYARCSALTSVTIPASVTTIGDYAFFACDILTSIISLNPVPPTVKEDTFGAITYQNATLHVLADSKDAYQQAEYWKNFFNIQDDATGIESVIEINEENFPDENFRNYLLQQDYGLDGKLTEDEINGITTINIYSTSNISSLKGIEYFTALTGLYCFDNQLTSLDVSKNTAMTYLWCNGNELTSLDVSKNTALTTLSCYSNQIKGEAMDALISVLPQDETNYYTYTIYVYYSGNDDNVCTKAQVAAAKAKGWTPYYHNGSSWLEYEGSDEESDGINAVSTDKQGNTAIYTLDGKRMNTTNAADLPKGIYIVNGKKVVIK